MTKEDLLSGLKREVVPVKVDNTTVLLKPWSAATRADFALWRKDFSGPKGLCAKLLQLSACDAAGNLLFGDGDVNDLDQLDGASLEKIAERVLKLNGLGDDDPGNS